MSCIGKIVQWADFEKSRRESNKISVECRSYEVRSADRNFLRPLILSKSGIEEVYCRLRSWSRAVAPGGLGEAQGVIFMMKIKMYAPVSNRGLVYKMLENYYLIDWLSFTAKLGDPLEVIQKVGLSDLNFDLVESARYGYNRNYTVDGLVNVMYSENRSDMGVHVEMTGQGVRKYESLMKIAGVTWVDVFEHLRSFVTFSD